MRIRGDSPVLKDNKYHACAHTTFLSQNFDPPKKINTSLPDHHLQIHDGTKDHYNHSCHV